MRSSLHSLSHRQTPCRHERLDSRGILSGDGPRRSGTMWLIFALSASIAPLGLILFRRYIRVPEAGRQDFA